MAWLKSTVASRSGVNLSARRARKAHACGLVTRCTGSRVDIARYCDFVTSFEGREGCPSQPCSSLALRATLSP